MDERDKKTKAKADEMMRIIGEATNVAKDAVIAESRLMAGGDGIDQSAIIITASTELFLHAMDALINPSEGKPNRRLVDLMGRLVANRIIPMIEDFADVVADIPAPTKH